MDKIYYVSGWVLTCLGYCSMCVALSSTVTPKERFYFVLISGVLFCTGVTMINPIIILK